jgi:hypothetical protein
VVWIFSLSAECGGEQAVAVAFSQHFQNVSWALSNGLQSKCCTTVFQDIDEHWWCRVCPSGVSEMGIEEPNAAYLMTELGILLYQQLQSAPAFRYALVGLEIDEFRTHRELLAESAGQLLPGLVLSEATWQMMASPTTFRAFSPGYVWQPYEGEVYKPLTVSPLLQAQMSDLLVA